LAGTRSLEDVRERRDELVAALSVNPMVPSADLAARVVDEILVRSPR
jgi:alpha-galactosidase/6-phospho-beta-glucosidase family protein